MFCYIWDAAKFLFDLNFPAVDTTRLGSFVHVDARVAHNSYKGIYNNISLACHWQSYQISICDKAAKVTSGQFSWQHTENSP